MNNFTNKRGQSEIIGLVVIVILLTLGLLFGLRFYLGKEKTDKVFTQDLDLLASTVVNTLIDVSVMECNGEEIKVEEAAEGGEATDGEDGAANAAGTAKKAAQKKRPPKISQLLEDCALLESGGATIENRYGCPLPQASAEVPDPPRASCSAANEVIRKLLKQTLGEWRKRYEFSAALFLDKEHPFVAILNEGTNKGCPVERGYHEQPLPITGGGQYEVKLAVCEQ